MVYLAYMPEEVVWMKKQILMTESYSPLYKQLMRKIRSDIASGV